MSNQTTDSTARLTDAAHLKGVISDVVTTTPVIDVHTHLYAPEFGDLTLFGIDELLTYHYLIAELFRSTKVTPDDFWQMNRSRQADLIWQTLFVDNTPLSEATRGVVTVLTAFGLDPSAPNLNEARKFFSSRSLPAHVNQVLQKARVAGVVMTNDPFDAREAYEWENRRNRDERFHASLRMDRLLNDWPNTSAKLTHAGYRVDPRGLNSKSLADVRRFLDRWIELMRPLYMAVSLPDTFTFPDSDPRDRIIREVVLTVARDHDLPFAMMVGVRRGVNPGLRWAGDGLGRADVKAVERMCLENPDVRFMATFLSRENQHELCVAARKFSNLMPFGCWWFLNNPSIIAEITRERLELLGSSFIPQHSDARILEQLIYKWEHSRRVIADVLYDLYSGLLASGRAVSRAEILRDVTRMLSGNFREWVNLPATNKVPAGAGEFAEPDMVTTK
jgi:hypothetical protein